MALFLPQCCTSAELQQPTLRMKSGLSDTTCFLLNTLNDKNSLSSLYFPLSWLLQQVDHSFTRDWGQPGWPGAACVILPALFKHSALVFHGNLPGLPRDVKNVPEIFLRQVFWIVWDKIYGLPSLKNLSIIDVLYFPLQLPSDWEVLCHPQVKKVLYPFSFQYLLSVYLLSITNCVIFFKKI